MYDFYTVAEVLNIAGGVHSGTETGVLQAAKLHVTAARPELTHAGDAIYHEYADDVLVGGMLKYRDGEMLVPQGAGLGIELDESKLAQYELTRRSTKSTMSTGLMSNGNTRFHRQDLTCSCAIFNLPRFKGGGAIENTQLDDPEFTTHRDDKGGEFQ